MMEPAAVRGRRAAREPRPGDRCRASSRSCGRSPTTATRSSSSSTASRKPSSSDRTASSTSTRARPATSAPSTGSSTIADPDAVKLPFDVVLDAGPRRAGCRTPPARAAREPTPRPPAAADAATAQPPRLEFRGVRAAIGDHEILHGVDARLGPDRDRGRCSARTARARRRCSGRRCASSPVTAGEVLVDGTSDRRRGRPPSSRPSSATSSRARARCSSPGRSRRSSSSGPRNLGRDPGDVRRARRRRAPADVPRPRSRTSSSAPAADPLVRPAEAARAGDRPGPAAADPDPRRAVGRARTTAPPRRSCARSSRSPGSKASTSSRTTWTLH